MVRTCRLFAIIARQNLRVIIGRFACIQTDLYFNDKSIIFITINTTLYTYIHLHLSLTSIFSAEDGPAVSGDFSVVPIGGYKSLPYNVI